MSKMNKRQIAQMVQDSLTGCRIENVRVVETTLVPEERKAIVELIITPDGSYSVSEGKVEVPYTPTPGSVKVRDQILFGCEINYHTNEGVAYFTEVPWEDLQKLVTEGYDVSTSIKEFPVKESVAELIEYMKEMNATAEGYATQTMVRVEKTTF